MLPVYPNEVTSNLSLKRNSLGNRSPEQYVKVLLQLPVVDPRYQRDKFGTKCNFFVRDFLLLMGIELPHALATQHIKSWSLPGSPLQPMVIQDAVSNANWGSPTVFGLLEETGHSHVGVVLPQTPVNSPSELLIANVGASNFYGKTLPYAVPKAKLSLVRYFGAV